MRLINYVQDKTNHPYVVGIFPPSPTNGAGGVPARREAAGSRLVGMWGENVLISMEQWVGTGRTAHLRTPSRGPTVAADVAARLPELTPEGLELRRRLHLCVTKQENATLQAQVTLVTLASVALGEMVFHMGMAPNQRVLSDE